MTGLPASVALVTSSKWRAAGSSLRTTLVGKLTLQLGEGGKADLTAPEAFVAFDRIAADVRYVLEASELMPWSSRPSVAVYRGPLRLTLDTARGSVVVTASARSPAGYSMTSRERSGFASTKPSRDADGVLTIPDDVDGRYFVAAPRAHQLDALRGDETFFLEVPRWECRGRLPGIAVTVDLDIAGHPRTVALTPDMLAVHGDTRRISVISRALVHGDATLLGHRVVGLDEAREADRGDPRRAAFEPLAEETSFLGGSRARPGSAPATPFERPSHPGSLPVDPPPPKWAGGEPAPVGTRPPAPPPPAPSASQAPKVAAPKPGAMAKPMLKRR